jgi:hypothetical protein
MVSSTVCRSSVELTAWETSSSARSSSTERVSFLTVDGNDSNELIVLEHRNTEVGPNATKFDVIDDRRMAFGISLCRCYVGNLDRLLGSDRLAKRTARRRIGTRCEHQGHTNGVHEHRSLCCYADRQD